MCIYIYMPISAVASDNVYDSLLGDKNSNETKTLDQIPGSTEETSSNTSNEVSSTWMFLTAFFKLVLATTAIVAIIYFGARIISEKRKRSQSSQNTQTLGVHALGQNKTLQIIRVGKKIYVIGVGDNINLIKELSEEEGTEFFADMEESYDTDASNNSMPSQFENIFKKKLTELKDRKNSLQHDQRENEREYL